MFRDRSLIPMEAVRLTALATLARAPRHYADAALEMRRLISRLVGPSLDMLGGSLEALRIEGLVGATDGEGAADNAVLHLTDAGAAELRRLLGAPLGVHGADLNRLVIALKLRLLDLLPSEEQLDQAQILEDQLAGERARLADLQGQLAGESTALDEWLALEISQTDARLAWVGALIGTLSRVQTN
jgi:DNA-binding PadR family transcriptional regulator